MNEKCKAIHFYTMIAMEYNYFRKRLNQPKGTFHEWFMKGMPSDKEHWAWTIDMKVLL